MYKRSLKDWFKHLDFIVIDIVLLQLCFNISYWILVKFANMYKVDYYRHRAVLLLLCQIVVAFFASTYKNIIRRKRSDEFFSVIKYSLNVAFIYMATILSIGRSSRFSIWFFLLTFGSFIILAFVLHQLNKRRLFRKSSDGINGGKRSIVLFTSSGLVKRVLGELTDNSTYHDYFISGIVLFDDGEIDLNLDTEIPVFRNGEEALQRIARGWVDEILVYQPDDMRYPKETIDTLMDMGIVIHYSLDAFNSSEWGKIDIEKVGNYKVLTNSLNMAPIGQLILKRIMDIIGSVIGSIFTLLLTFIISPLIYFTDKGPIFFVQERIGKNGKVFKMFKFRTMYMDAEERKKDLMQHNEFGSDFMFKMDDDPRILGSEKKNKKGEPKGIGNFLRNTSIDEFPQFFNVLIGNMSLVGTRPPTLDEWKRYDLHHRARMSVKPGITGMWQVSGRSDIKDFEEVVRLDKEYIENWSIFLDIKILIKTVLVVLKHEGAK